FAKRHIPAADIPAADNPAADIPAADIPAADIRAADMRGALLICGTQSDAGKSLVTAGICRWLRRAGVSVAPFKAQNMALNSVVTRDGREIGRSQAMQAAAAGL